MDVDTIRDARLISGLIRSFDETDVKATFFITTGPDETYKNLRNYLAHPLRLISTGAIQRYGADSLRGLFRKENVEDHVDLRAIIEGGHEIGLHGYRHHQWMRRGDRFSYEEALGSIEKGLEGLSKAGLRPDCFAAPGFKVNDDVLRAIDEFGFRYSSDHYGTETFHPKVGGKRLITPQVPVTLSLDETPPPQLKKEVRKQLDQDHALFYLHPSGLPRLEGKLFSEILGMIKGRGRSLGELVA